MPKNKRSLEDGYDMYNPAHFIENNPSFKYYADNINPIYVDNNTGEVWQNNKPRGSVILPNVEVKGKNIKAIEDLSTVAYSAYKGYENNIGKMRKENKRLTDISEENQQEHQFFKKDLRSLHSKILNHNTRISSLEKIKKQKEEIKI